MISSENYKKYSQNRASKYYNNGFKYLDPFRKKLVNVTPEENVRLKTAFFIRDVLGIPSEMIFIEEHLSHYGVRKNFRADIVVCPWNSKPLAIIECKSRRVGLSDQAREQAFRYAVYLDTKYVFICDGASIECYAKERKDSSYVRQVALPHYREMIDDIFTPAKPETKIIRRAKLSTKINSNDYFWCIGEDTRIELHSSIVNLAEAFLDTSHSIQPTIHKGIEFIEDLGLSYRQYGDASGSQFGTGEFRLLLVKHPNKKTYIYGLSIQATGKTVNDKKYGNSSGKSVLIVSRTDAKTDEMAVQINLNTFLEITNDQNLITHNGKFGIKKARSHKFMEKVQMDAPDLINKEKLLIGRLPADRLLYVDQIEMLDFISNLFIYCDLRMKYKKTIRRKKRNHTIS